MYIYTNTEIEFFILIPFNNFFLLKKIITILNFYYLIDNAVCRSTPMLDYMPSSSCQI